MKTLTKNKKLAIVTLVVMLITILSVSIGLIVTAIESNRKVVADTDKGQLLSGKVYDMPKQLTLTDMADGEGVNLKVILKPSFVENAKINFAIKWKDAAVEDDINTYLTLTTVSDTQCNIKIAQRFNNQIELVATAEIDSSITKTCAVDCYSYFEELNYTVRFGEYEFTRVMTGNSTDKIIGNTLDYLPVMNAITPITLNKLSDFVIAVDFDYKLGAGTKAYINNVEFSFELSSDGYGDSGVFDEFGSTLIKDSSEVIIIAKNRAGSFGYNKTIDMNYFIDIFKSYYPATYKGEYDIPYEDTDAFFYENSKESFFRYISTCFFIRFSKPNEVRDELFYMFDHVGINYLYDMSFEDSITMT